jgi:ribosomal protein S18 acetylase RimI-like enzyme
VEEAFLRQGFRSRDRRYLIRDVASTSGDFNVSAGLRRIRNGDLERIGRLVYESHRGSADAALNVTYASAEGSLQFVDSIISRSGCGVFDTQASLVAEAHESLGGVILVTRISHDHAHVCQISVNPDRQRTGIGNALLSAALAALKRAGLQRVTLSVTEDNTSAKRLYERHGFRPRRAFASYAWVRPPGRIPLVP